MQNKEYTADLYLRLSREDGDKEESESIANQKAFLLEYLKNHPEIKLNKIRCDDGYTGTNTNRPEFLAMLEDIKNGEINTIICRDLSRFSRNYIESGRYIQVLFPQIGVRFIAVNDGYDSLHSQNSDKNIIIPFKNMVNDGYCCDISIKIRSSLETKRKKGDYLSAFAVYGYIKNPENHNKLIVDDLAAGIVQEIFNCKLSGMSAQAIANKLNSLGVLSPLEYKKSCGLNYKTPFQIGTSKWTAKAIFRILTNEIYIGVIEQGKQTTPNYKVKRIENVPKEKWIRIENVHQPIIDKSDFETVQSILKQDTRACGNGENIRPLSGMIVCADCNSPMVMKTNTNRSGKKYSYYVCSEHRADKTKCSTHILSVTECEKAVLQAIQSYINLLLDMERVLKTAESKPYKQSNVRKLTAILESKKDEIKRYDEYKLSLFESYRDGDITKQDFIKFKSDYDNKINDCENSIENLQLEIDNLIVQDNYDWIEIFKQRAGAETLDRRIVIELIEKVYVYEKGKVEVIFRYANEFANLSFAIKGVA